MNDRDYMKRALELARRGAGTTSPNPMVGSVIVKNGRIIGEGYHQRFGGKHAEVNAIENASESVAGATLYCNMEPCCHTIPNKKTPPCTLRLIREKIKKVVVATLDPNPYVNGNGVDMLRRNGIEVEVGILASEAAFLNEKYFKFIRTGLPFVHLKIAQSIDGRIATRNGNSQWITDREARRTVHRMRADYDAVLVGANTVRKDNPSLTVRLAEGRQPFRVLLSTRLDIPGDASLLTDEYRQKTIVFTAQPTESPAARELQERGVRVITVGQDAGGNLLLREVLAALAEMNISSVLVEGGGSVFTSFIREELFDKISVFMAPIFLGEGVGSIGDLGLQSIDAAVKLLRPTYTIINNQILAEGYRDLKTIFGELPEEE